MPGKTPEGELRIQTKCSRLEERPQERLSEWIKPKKKKGSASDANKLQPHTHSPMPREPMKANNKRVRKPKPWQQTTLKPDLPPPPLPKLLLQNDDEEVEVVNIAVQPRPAIGEGRGLTWVAEERPTTQIGTGQLITLSTEGRTTGIGRLATVTDLRQHWVTWTITGGRRQCSLRAPIPWAQLTEIESYAHTQHYKLLPKTPIPHHDYSHDPTLLLSEESPYDFDLDEETARGMTKRIARITGEKKLARREP